VINVRHLGEKIQDYLGNGQEWGVNITYSVESNELEVGGGILQALPMLGEDPFIIVNGDIWTDYPLASLQYEHGLAQLVLVDNPEHNPIGDFCIEDNGLLSRRETPRLTYSGISVLHPALFDGCIQGESFRLAPLLDKAISQKALYGEFYHGQWTDVGTLERLETLEESLTHHSLQTKMNY
jgi:MurNAc alpha-1-phosphate uridylyltransferase